MKSFRTTFNIPQPDFTIDHTKRGLLIGSCFAENIAARLVAAKFDVVSNPTGVVYNPLSVALVLNEISRGRILTLSDLRQEPQSELWSSFLFHGSFSRVDPRGAIDKMNSAIATAQKGLQGADYVVVTFGTAWIYELVDGGEVVANCHKFPPSHFARRRVRVEEIVETIGGLLNTILADKEVVFTLSPVRHLKDGVAENSISKAVLLLAIEELCAKYRNANYFPAYEIMNDDLRDYRFYGEDMIHPSKVAVDYIWDKFCGWCVSDSSQKLVEQMDKINSSISHRVFNPNSPAHIEFRKGVAARLRSLAKQYPTIDFSSEFNFFETPNE